MFNLFKWQALGHLGYQNADIGTLANLVSMGRLDLSRSISDVVSLENVAAGIEKLESGPTGTRSESWCSPEESARRRGYAPNEGVGAALPLINGRSR